MLIVAIVALALAVLVGVGRGRLGARSVWRFLTLTLAAAAAASAVWSGMRGEWLGALLLVGSAIWLGASAQAPTRMSAASQSRAEAAAILGVAETATRAEVEAAYRRLMLRVHPDQGGAPGLAAQLNLAREAMLKGRNAPS